MKMLKIVAGTAFLLLLATTAQAVPKFTGDTYADWGVGGVPAATAAQGPGYYIWCNDEAGTSWSVRWTGGNWQDGYKVNKKGVSTAISYGSFTWRGTVSGAAITSVTPVSWDASDSKAGKPRINAKGQIVFYGSKGGNSWDGFDFTIDPNNKKPIYFHLNGRIFYVPSKGGLGYVAPQGVYLGENEYQITDFYTGSLQGMLGSANFYIGAAANSSNLTPTPEPATIFMVGAGLAGIVGLRRKKS